MLGLGLMPQEIKVVGLGVVIIHGVTVLTCEKEYSRSHVTSTSGAVSGVENLANLMHGILNKRFIRSSAAKRIPEPASYY